MTIVLMGEGFRAETAMVVGASIQQLDAGEFSRFMLDRLRSFWKWPANNFMLILSGGFLLISARF